MHFFFFSSCVPRTDLLTTTYQGGAEEGRCLEAAIEWGPPFPGPIRPTDHNPTQRTVKEGTGTDPMSERRKEVSKRAVAGSWGQNKPYSVSRSGDKIAVGGSCEQCGLGSHDQMERRLYMQHRWWLGIHRCCLGPCLCRGKS